MNITSKRTSGTFIGLKGQYIEKGDWTKIDTKKAPARRPGPKCRASAGGALLSHGAAPAVPSALAGLTSGFGMGPGVPPPPRPPAAAKRSAPLGAALPGPSLGALGAAWRGDGVRDGGGRAARRACAPRRACPGARPISAARLRASRPLHLRPIDLVFCEGAGVEGSSRGRLRA